MYARGMSQRDIVATIEDIYGFQMSHEQISTITGCVMEEVEAWRNRPLQSFYPFAFVDHLRIAAHGSMASSRWLARVMLAMTSTAARMSLASGSTRRRAACLMQIFDELRARGVKDLGILSMDGVSGLEEGAKAVFPACHGSALHRTPHPQFHPLTSHASSGCIHEAAEAHLWCHQRQQARQEPEKFKTDWQAYPGAVSMGNNFQHVEQLYNYGSAVRKIMYTTNAIESVNSSFRKVTKKGASPTRCSSRFSTYASKSSIKNGRVVTGVANWAMVRTSCSWTTGYLMFAQQYDVAY